MIQAILYGWIFGIERGDEELHRGAHIRVPFFVQEILKYVTPVYLLAIFAGICYTSGSTYWQNVSKPGVPRNSILLIGAIFVVLLLLVRIAGKRWEREGRLKYR
jgi:hypothetical protein